MEKYTRTKLQDALYSVAPLIRIRTIWEKDMDSAREWSELTKKGNCFEGEKRQDWTCWQSEIEALVIVDFEQVKASAYLGGTWERKGDHPAVSNPDISGYELQMTVEALEEIEKLVSKSDTLRLSIAQAIAACNQFKA